MLVIGIAGGTGSGKTTVVNKILERLDEKQVTVIPQDSYYKDNSHLPLEKRQELNFDHPQSIDWELMVEHLLMLKSGAAIERPMYSYITCTRLPESIHTEPTQIIIVEGILIFTDPPLRNCLDMKIFVDADADDRLSRVISRDIVERGRSVNKVLERYEKTVKPMHLQFIEPTKRYADIIIPQGGHNTVAINMLISTIERALLSS
ncbi:MAG: uridine kinase [Bacteroidales bacterium]|jgi:uridine kinase|nr:uridine kinase [Bacteroidales bacterium]NLH23799.1 uridine kinase [Bacteroidales bacterium]HPJ82731.1 uridine kinase [Bacteroidales bacterium]